MLYFNARYYDPKIGRFITEDPAKDGLNWYVYCENNPIRKIDPTGLADKEAGADSEPSPVEEPEIAPPGWDPTVPPGEEWEWRGKPGSKPGDKDGSWYHPGKGSSLHPDLEHPAPIGPHWDYTPEKGKGKTRIDPDTGKPFSNRNGMPAVPISDYARIGIGALGVGIVAFDILTFPSGEGLFGIALLEQAFGR